MIPMVDLQIQYQRLKAEIDANVLDVLAKGHYILGPHVQAFEAEAAHYLGVKHAIGVASGTDAIYLALMAEGIKAGDEVITTPFSFIAACEAIRYLGAKPVFIDIDPKTYNIDVNKIASAITDKTRAIIPVHLYGQVVELEPILNLAKKHNLIVIEDCAQSFGALYQGRQTGSMGEFGCFSFYPTKTLGGFGDGGLITMQSDERARHVRSLRAHGSEIRYEHTEIGLNSRLDEIQAAILRVKLKYLDEFNLARRRIAAQYNELLSDTNVVTPTEIYAGGHVYHQYTILTDCRSEIMQALNKMNIASSIHYPKPIHRQPVFLETYSHLHFPHSEDVARRCLSLPIYPEMTDEQVRAVAQVIREVTLG